MLKNWVTILTPLVLAPLGSLLTPVVAHADYSYWIPVQRCNFGGRDYTPWSAQIRVRSADKSARITRIQFGNGGNDEKIVQLQVREWKDQTIKRTRTYKFSPPIKQWDQTMSLPFVSPEGRYATLWLYNADTRSCQSRVNF